GHTDVPVHVAPNAINIPWYEDRLVLELDRRAPTETLTIGWGGGWRPGDDTELFSRVWLRLAERFPDIKFVLVGWAPPEIKEVISPSRLVEYEWQDIDAYPYFLRNIDIACCVVADNVFNRGKTPIKWFESTLAGSACVGSHMLYGSVITDGHDGLLATTEQEWETQLARLIESPDLRQHLHANA